MCFNRCWHIIYGFVMAGGTGKGAERMNAFAQEMHKAEVQRKWGDTAAYKEHCEKTGNYSDGKWNDLAESMDSILAEFAHCMKNGAAPDSAQAQNLVNLLQGHITEHYYRCTNEILAGLGQMYVADQRFQNNIDKHGEGTAAFICKAIESYCRK